MGRNSYILPAVGIVVFLIEIRNGAKVVLRIGELPYSVQRVSKACFSCRKLLFTSVCYMIRCCGKDIYLEHLRILNYLIIKLFHNNSFPRLYLTEPVIPSANCFCNMKKMTMVGIEQKSTPIMSWP